MAGRADPDRAVARHGRKIALWIILVTLIPLVGAILWFAVGRPAARREAVPAYRQAQYPYPPQPPADYRQPPQL